MVKSVNVGILESERQDDVQQTNVFSTKLITRHITRKFFFYKTWLLLCLRICYYYFCYSNQCL